MPIDEEPVTQSFWNRPVVLVLLSSFISGVFVSMGWKASIDSVNAVHTVKITEHEDRIHQLELADKERIKATDLAIRDQLLDTKLSLLQSEIADIKEQLRRR